MITVVIAVLAILLTIAVYKSTKTEVHNLCTNYAVLIKQFLVKKTFNEFKDDMKHAGATLVKAFGQIGRALKLVTYWLLVPVFIVLIPLIIVVVALYVALTK